MKRAMSVLHLCICVVCLASLQTFARPDAQWRGPLRDGIYEGTKLLTAWPEKGPTLLLTIKDIGTGYSSPAVTRDRIYISGMAPDSMGYIHAFDLKGTLQWKSAYGREWTDAYPGVRASPTIAGNRLYMQSGRGRVVCLDTEKGKEVWAVDMAQVFGARMPKWGHNESVLLMGDKVICTPGGTRAAVAALDRNTGKTIWTTPDISEMSGYCSPIPVRHGKHELLVTMLGKSIIGIDPASGKLLWKEAHPTDHGVNANTPIYVNGNILYTSGYGQGAAMLKLSEDGKSAEKVWSNPTFDVQMGGAVLIGDHLYGSGHKNPAWHSLDIKTGEIRHSSTAIGRGALVSAGGLLYCYSESGAMSLVKPGADSFQVIGSTQITDGSGPHWAHPVVAGGRLYVRRGEVVLVYAIAG